MKDGEQTWKRVGEYFESMTDLTVATVQDVGDEWAGWWNADGDKSRADATFDAIRESVGVGLRASAKAWVATRKLMLDLAE